MNCDKWEDVLIQWINCLKLTDPVSDLESLRNGKFFIKLLGILEPPNISIARNESLTHILEILKTQYLNYEFVKKDVSDLETLPVKDIVIIASLLMHYTCIVERKDSLIIPSCNKLPPDIQLNIRNFLEKVNTKITEFHLNKIIEEMNESNISLCSYQWRPTGDSPLIDKSPLQDFLRTPNTKALKYEKERELKKLKADLETERFEKSDLLEEIKEYKEKMKKLEKQIKEKSNEISKLQRECYNLEFSSPPHTNQSFTLDMEKQYKSRIQNLESFCDQLQNKQDQLQEVNMDLTDKLKVSLEELKVWQQTSQSLELNNKDLLEKSTRQAIELDCLNSQCSELTAILDEMRNNKDGNDSSLVYSPLKTKRRSVNERCFENLAHTIVDVQLKDAQKENEELKTFLKEASEKGNNLEKELEDLKINYNELSKRSSDLENCKKDLMKEVEELYKIKTSLEENHLQVKSDLEEKLDIVNNELEKIKGELLNIKDDKNSLQVEIATLNSSNQDLIEEKENLMSDIREMELQLKLNLEKLNKFEDECNHKEIIISNTTDTLSKIRSDLQSKEHDFEILVQTMKELNGEASSYKICIQNLETKNSEFENQLKILQDDLQILSNSKETLEGKNLTLEENVHNLTSELATKSKEMNEVIENLNQQTIDDENQMEMLNQLLEEANKNINCLENEKSDIIDKSNREISDQTNEINRLNNQIYELNAKEVDYIQEIKSIKSELNTAYEKYSQSFDYQQELKSEYEAQFKNLTENIHEIISNYNQLEKDYQSTQSDLEILSVEKEKSEKEIMTLRLTIEHYGEEIEDINKQFASDHNKLELEKLNLQQSLANSEKKLAELKVVEKTLENELCALFEKIELEKDEKSNLIKKIEHLESTKAQLQIDAESLRVNHDKYIKENEINMKQREDEFQEYCKSLTEQSTKLKEELEAEILDKERTYDREIENLNDQFNSNLRELQIKESVLNESLVKVQSELEQQKQIEINSRTKINVMQNKIDDLDIENEILLNKIECLEQYLKQLLSDLEQQKKVGAKLESNVETLHNTINDIGIEKEKLMEETVSLEKTKIQLEEDCNSLKQVQEEFILNNENKLKQFEHDTKIKLEVLNKDLMNAVEEKCQLSKEIQDQRSKYDEEIQNIHEKYAIDISQFGIKENNLEQSLKILENELEQQNVVKLKLSGDVQEMSNKIKNLENQKIELMKNIVSLENNKCEIETKYGTCNEDNIKQQHEFKVNIDHLRNENKDLQKRVDELQHEIQSLELENKRYSEALEVNDRRYGEEIEILTSKMNLLQTQNDKIEKYKETIQEQIDYICQLKTDYKKLEDHLEIVQKSHKKLEDDQTTKQLETNCVIAQNVEKDKEILIINQELLEMQKVNENMKVEKELLDTELRKSKECHKIFINKISKDNIAIHDYNVLEIKYIEIAKEISQSAEETKELKKNLEESSKKLIDMHKIIENKDATLEELRNRLKHSEEAQTHNVAVIKELTEELTDNVNNLLMVKNEKIKINVDLEKAHIEIDRLKRSRDDILDAQTKIIRETENNISRAHENAIDVKNELLMSIENAKEEASIERKEKIKLQSMLEDEKSAVKYLEIELLNAKQERPKYENSYLIMKESISRLYDLLELNLDVPIEEENLKQITIQLEQKIDQTFKTNEDVTDSLVKIKKDYAELTTKMQTTKNEEQLNEHYNKLSMQYDNLLQEKLLILQQLEEKEKLQEEVNVWRNKYEEMSKNHGMDNLKKENEVLHQTVMSLKDNNVKVYTTLKEFLEASRSFKNAIDKILKDRNSLETLVNELKQSLITLQTKFISRDSSAKHREQKEAFETIVDDISKQFNRYSKMSYNIACNNAQISEKVIQGILNEKYIDYQPFLNNLNIEEVTDKLDELKGRTTDTLEQLKLFEEALNKPDVKNTKILKENVLKTSSSADLKKDEEWRKKYTVIRQKWTLSENVKNNYEKKVKQLREENRKLSEMKNLNYDLDNDPGYKILLQQHIQAKEDFENKISELKMKYQRLHCEYLEYKKQKAPTEQQTLNANLESELSELRTNYQKILVEYENLKENQQVQKEIIDNKNEKEIETIKEAYSKVMSDNSKLEFENITLKKLIDDRNHDENLKENQQLQVHQEIIDKNGKEIQALREAYMKVMSENSKLELENTSLKKRIDDRNLDENLKENRELEIHLEIMDKNGKEIQALREAYVKVMSDKSKLEIDNTTLRKVIDDRKHELLELSLIKEAYDKLLEENSKMMTQVDTLKYKRGRDKEEFLHLIKKEREDRDSKENRKIQQIRTEYEEKLESMKRKMLSLYKEEVDKETRRLTNNSEMLKLELEDSKRTIHQLKKSQRLDFLGSQESLGSLSIKSECDARDMRNSRGAIIRDVRISKSITGPPLKSGVHDRRYATMPRSMSIIEETVRRSSIQPDLGPNLEMEDEDELFNNKYLMDLKEGHCVINDFTEPKSSRVSELVWRNSLCPPHLKSSYPAEMQFSSPTHFKEDDIKTGNVDFDDSMSTKLLPGEKVRNKKDIGTTSYKKPGPPTPSKNGGRLSLQSNEIQPLKDIQDTESKTPKRTTPSRLKAFFLGFNSNSRNGIEGQPGTPKPKGTRIFRKPR